MFFYPHLSSLWLYFNFVAIPPLICLSALFSSNMFLTSCANIRFILSSLSLTSLCTVVFNLQFDDKLLQSSTLTTLDVSKSFTVLNSLFFNLIIFAYCSINKFIFIFNVSE